MNRLLSAVFGLFLGSASGAGAATYNYTSEPGYCDYDGACWFEDGSQWAARFGIDESTLPGQSLANGTLTFEVAKVQQYNGQPVRYGTYVTTVSFFSPSGSYQYEALGSYPAGSFWDLGEFTFTEWISFFTWTFDDEAQIVSWFGSAFCGGSCDQTSSSNEGDWVDDGWSTNGPGTWTRVADPAPVPLPATGLLLAAALAGVGVTLRRRKAVA